MRGRIGLALAMAGAALGSGMTAAAPSAQPWLDMPAATPLEHLDQRLDLRAVDSGAGVDIAALAVELQGQEVPAAAVTTLAAPLLPEDGFARRVGVFFAGVARWIGDRLWTDGLTAGADVPVGGDGAVGIAASYMNPPGGDDLSGAETAAVTLYGSLAPPGGPRLDAMAGVGRAVDDGSGAAGAVLGFGQIGAQWRSDLGGGFGLAQDLRLGVAADPRADQGTGYALHGAAGLSLDGQWTVPAGDLGLSTGVSWQGALGLRLGVTLTERTGETYSLELADKAPEHPAGGQLVRIGWSSRF